jgi:guanosine-3',5'-bis(diphosphate) 3'-pyrophosphohydrolase
MPLHWQAEEVDDVRFSAYLCIHMMMNDEQISDLIYQCRKAKTGVEMVESQDHKTYVNIVVSNRNQIAQIIRDLRMHFGFPRIERLNMPIVQTEIAKV